MIPGAVYSTMAPVLTLTVRMPVTVKITSLAVVQLPILRTRLIPNDLEVLEHPRNISSDVGNSDTTGDHTEDTCIGSVGVNANPMMRLLAKAWF